MQIDVEDKQLSVVLNEAKFDAVITAEAPLDVNVGESAKIDVGQAIDYIKSGQAEVQAVVDSGTAAFNANAIAKTNAFNANATDKTNTFNQNATDKTTDFNSNASDKTTDFNDNYTAKLGDFNDNAVDKTNDFNSNASDKTGDFNDNATNKTNDFNDNYTAKKEIIDDAVSDAQGYATTAKQYAIGDPSEPAGNSAKYWAEQASSSLSGLSSRVSTIEGEIPAEASASNQLADKNYVASVLPTVNNATLTIQKNGTDVQTFTANASANVTANITVPTQPSDIGAQDALVSGTNIKTINNNSILGSGNLDIDALPSQTGQSGKYLTTDGTDASWANVDALPSQTGQSGKYLTTDGSSASWATVSTTPSIDNKSITTNGSSQLQTIGVIDQNNTSTAIKTWSGTKAQYDAIVTKDANTLYNITDDTTSGADIYSKAEVDSLLNTKASVSLNNLVINVAQYTDLGTHTVVKNGTVTFPQDITQFDYLIALAVSYAQNFKGVAFSSGTRVKMTSFWIGVDSLNGTPYAQSYSIDMSKTNDNTYTVWSCGWMNLLATSGVLNEATRELHFYGVKMI